MIRFSWETSRVLSLFGLLLVIGFVAVDEFPITTDETIMNTFGREAYGYITGENPWPSSLESRFHGPFVEIVIFWLSMQIFTAAYHTGFALGPADLVIVRHFLIYLTFLSGLLTFYFLCKRHFRDPTMGILGVLLLVASPRIFGDAFVNSRDIPHLAFFTMAVLTLLRVREQPTIATALVHGIVCGMDIATRSLGVLLPMLTVVSLLRTPRVVGVSLLSLCISTFLFWPLLWENPLRFVEALQYFSSFHGEAWYSPVLWIGVTTPVIYLALFVLGLSRYTRNDWLFLAWLFVPVLLAIARSGTYNGWRHLYFVYPALLVFALKGFQVVRWRWKTHVIAATVFFYASWAWVNYPLGYLYFNLPPSLVLGLERDYWGMSSRILLDRIASSDPRQRIGLRVSNNITLKNAELFFPGRFYRSDFPDYVINTSDEPGIGDFLNLDVGGIRVASVSKR